MKIRWSNKGVSAVQFLPVDGIDLVLHYISSIDLFLWAPVPPTTKFWKVYVKNTCNCHQYLQIWRGPIWNISSKSKALLCSFLCWFSTMSMIWDSWECTDVVCCVYHWWNAKQIEEDSEHELIPFACRLLTSYSRCRNKRSRCSEPGQCGLERVSFQPRWPIKSTDWAEYIQVYIEVKSPQM